MNTQDRFKKRLALSMARNSLREERISSSPTSNFPLHSPSYSHIMNWADELTSSTPSALEIDTLLVEVREGLDEHKFTDLLEACQRECLQAIIRPFGIAKILFEDKLGGNVTTINNLRSSEYKNSDDTAWAKTGEKEKYEAAMMQYESQKRAYKEYLKSQKEYKKWLDGGSIGEAPEKPNPAQDPKYKYRNGNKNYSDTKARYAEKKASGELSDPIRDENFSQNDKIEVDHAYACEKIETDPARILAEIYGPDLANISENLNPMLEHVNRSKRDLSAEEIVDYWKKEEPERIKNIEKLREMQEKGLTTPEQDLRLTKLQQLQDIDKKKLIKAVKKGERKINSIIAEKYYASEKFAVNVAATSLSEGAKAGLQQSIGLLMEEFVRACFAEVKDVWLNGFKERVDDTFLNALKERLSRIAHRVQSRWKDALHAFKDGFISGFFSNLVTVIINMFATTSARVVHIIREGFWSLCRALKMLAFPPDGMSAAQAADAASKLLATGLITSGGIMIEQAIENSLQFLGPLASYVSAISVGLVTGLCTVFSVYILERLDIFGVRANSHHDQIVAKLNNMVSVSYSEALSAASVFEGPALLHLATSKS